MKDFFISYNSADQTWAEWIAWQLEEAHYTTVLQAWDFLPGENFILRMHEAAKDTRSTIIVLSPAFINSNFTQPEWAAAFRKDPQGKARQLIPVRIAACEPEGLLGPIVYIDLAGVKETEAKEKLLHGLKSERKKPPAKPFFPGASRRSVPAEPDYPGLRRSAIKSLRPFEFEDAELFRRLQREGSLQECLEAISDRDFRFGILSGESGCGKTSFLQAGLRPRLLAQTVPHRCIYVKLTDLDPLDSIRQALTDQLQLPKESLAGLDLLPLLAVAVQADPQPLVLLFDQFEQFFAHRKLREEREPFVNALANWYKSKLPLPCQMIVCIRGDFKYRLDELQKTMGYALGPQQNFSLEKFTPAEATQIFRIMAETEGLAGDENFVKELAEQELASREDGLVSPVDVQILAWMIKGQKAVAERAFNRQVYQKLGGIAGLLEKYLERALEARETEDRREAAIKVLWALTDWERNIRAGVLTVDDLTNKLAGTVSTEEMQEAVEWLARSDVRLITPSKRHGAAGYELAHERLIPALRRLAGKKFSAADQANQLLERRVNEWLGNERAGRYLLSWQEMRLIGRQKPYLIWGQRQTQKQDLLQQSRRRLWRRAGLASFPLIFILAIVIWWQSPLRQINSVKSRLISISSKVKDSDTIEEIVIAFAKQADWEQASQISETILDDAEKSGGENLKVFVFHALATTAAEMGEKDKAIAYLARGEKIAKTIPDDKRSDKVNVKVLAFRALAKAAAEMGEKDKTMAYFTRGEEIAKNIPDYVLSEGVNVKAFAFLALAEAAAEMAKSTKDVTYLTCGEAVTKAVPDDAAIDGINVKVLAFRALAKAAAETGEKDKAMAYFIRGEEIAKNIPGYEDDHADFSFVMISKFFTFLAVAKTAAEMAKSTKEVAYLAHGEEIAKAIPDDETSQGENLKVFAFQGLAVAAAEMGEKDKAMAYLTRGEEIAKTIPDDETKLWTERLKVRTFFALAVAAAEMVKSAKDMAYLARGEEIVRTIVAYEKASYGQNFKVHAFCALAAAAADMSEKDKAMAYLTRGEEIAKTISDDEKIRNRENITSLAFQALAKAAAEMAKSTNDLAYLARGEGIAKNILDDATIWYEKSAKALALSMLASVAAELGEKNRAKAYLARSQKIDIRESDLLLDLATAAARIGEWQQARDFAEANVNDADKAQALAAILKVWGERQYPALAETAAEEEWFKRRK